MTPEIARVVRGPDRWAVRHMEGTCEYPDSKAFTAYRKGCRCRRCKDGNNAWQREYHRRNPTKAIQYIRRRKYRIEPEDYEQMLSSQGGLCAICRTEPPKPVVDHCHSSGDVRGVLCSNCNTGIGLLKHSPDRLWAAIEYLLRNGDLNNERA